MDGVTQLALRLETVPIYPKAKEVCCTMSLKPELKQTIRELVYPELKDVGFKKRGFVFSRHGGDVIQIVEFQVSSWNSEEALSVYINAGIYAEGVITGWNPSVEEPRKPQCFHSALSTRLANPPDFFGYSDSTVPTTFVAHCVAEIRQATASLFDRIDSVVNLISFLVELAEGPDSSSFYPVAASRRLANAALLLLRSGEKTQAIALMGRAVDAGRGQPGEESLIELFDRISKN